MRDSIHQLATQCAGCVNDALLLASVRGDQRAQLGGAGIATLYDGLRAVLLLLNSDAEWQAGTVARSMIETYADVAALAAHPEYVRRMALESHLQQRRLYANLAKAGTVPDAAEKAVYHADHAAVLEKDGIKRLTIAQRFDAATLPVDFRLIYADLSIGAHGDYVALHVRHLGTGSIRVGEKMSDYAFLKCAWVAATMAHGAVALLPHFSDVDSAVLERTLAPAFGYETQMSNYRESALATQAQEMHER